MDGSKEQLEMAKAELVEQREAYEELKKMYLACERELLAAKADIEKVEHERDEYKRALDRERRDKAERESESSLTFNTVEIKDGKYCVVTGASQDAVSITIPLRHDGLAVIGIEEGAFKNRMGLMKVDIPYGVRAISDDAFSGCALLKQVVVPRSVVWIGRTAFEGCPNVTLICHGDSAARAFAEMRGIDFTDERE